MIGPPGAGKTMLAKRLPMIIPPLTLEEALETTKIHSVAGKIDDHTELMTKRPLRSPHHTISDFVLVGRGQSSLMLNSINKPYRKVGSPKKYLTLDINPITMKNLTVSLLIICFGSFSCSNPTSQKNTVVNNVPDTAGYFAARNMKGIAAFKICETKYSQALKIIKDEIRKDSRRFKETNYKEMPKYHGYEAKYPDFTFDKNGNIASSFNREYFDLIIKEVKYDTLNNYLKEDLIKEEIFGCPNIKAIKIFQYYIGDIELMNFELKFYQDTLYKISCNQQDKIESGFKEKYGDGRSIINNEWKTPFGIKNEAPENDAIRKKSQLLKIDEKNIWENESVKAVSQTYIQYEYKGGSDSFSDAYSDSYFAMDSKNTKLKDNITECENNASKAKQRLEEQKKQKELNQL